jgi:hypothetical protein
VQGWRGYWEECAVRSGSLAELYFDLIVDALHNSVSKPLVKANSILD